MTEHRQGTSDVFASADIVIDHRGRVLKVRNKEALQELRVYLLDPQGEPIPVHYE